MSKIKATTSERIDALMERAESALQNTDYFTAESVAASALDLAHRGLDYDRMARILMPLEEARRQKRLLAADAGFTGRMTTLPGDDWPDRPGCWLVEPPRVGADARELRLRADERGVPAIVICREPETDSGAWPIVAIGVKTVRTTIAPPSGNTPSPSWFVEAAEALGDAAINSVDPARPPASRVDNLMAVLQTLRDHDRLHQALVDACRAALRAEGTPTRRAG